MNVILSVIRPLATNGRVFCLGNLECALMRARIELHVMLSCLILYLFLFSGSLFAWNDPTPPPERLPVSYGKCGEKYELKADLITKKHPYGGYLSTTGDFYLVNRITQKKYEFDKKSLSSKKREVLYAKTENSEAVGIISFKGYGVTEYAYYILSGDSSSNVKEGGICLRVKYPESVNYTLVEEASDKKSLKRDDGQLFPLTKKILNLDPILNSAGEPFFVLFAEESKDYQLIVIEFEGLMGKDYLFYKFFRGGENVLTVALLKKS